VTLGLVLGSRLVLGLLFIGLGLGLFLNLALLISLNKTSMKLIMKTNFLVGFETGSRRTPGKSNISRSRGGYWKNLSWRSSFYWSWDWEMMEGRSFKDW